MSKRKRPPQAQVLARRQATQSKLRTAGVTTPGAAVVVGDHEDPPNLDRAGTVQYGSSAEKVKGSAFEWGEGLFYDVDTGAYYDRGEYEARDYKDMLRVYHKARALDNVLTLPILMADWKLIPGKGDRGECESIEEKLRRPANAGGMTTPMRQIIGQMTSAFVMRRAYFAKGFKLDTVADDGSVMYSQLAFRPQTTCRLLRDAEDGSFRGFEQDLVWYANTAKRQEWSGKPIQFTPRESMVFINGTHRDPIGGISELEIVYWCWRTQQKLLFLWYDYLAGQALPRTLVKSSGDPAKAKEAAQIIAKLKSSGVGYFDGNELSVDVLDVAGRGPQPFMEAITYLDKAASGSVMASFTDLGAAAAGDASGGARGSFALSKDQTDFFLQGRISASHEIEDCLTNYMIADLVHYNYGPDGVVPQFQFLPLQGVDEQPVIGLLTALAAAPPGGPIPYEMIAELCIEAARVLKLDVDKITKAVIDGAATAKANAEAIQQKQGAPAPTVHAAGGAAALSSAADTIRGIAQSNGRAPRELVPAPH